MRNSLKNLDFYTCKQCVVQSMFRLLTFLGLRQTTVDKKLHFMEGKKKLGGQILTSYRQKFPSHYQLHFIMEDIIIPNLPFWVALN